MYGRHRSSGGTSSSSSLCTPGKKDGQKTRILITTKLFAFVCHEVVAKISRLAGSSRCDSSAARDFFLIESSRYAKHAVPKEGAEYVLDNTARSL